MVLAIVRIFDAEGISPQNALCFKTRSFLSQDDLQFFE